MNLASKLNRRITILRPPGQDKKNEYGEPLKGERQPITKLWASIEPLTGRELYAAMQISAEVTARIRIRFRKGLNRNMIVRHDDAEFEIMYIVRPEYGNTELLLMCKERQ